jgi:hypothetical protein
VDGPLHVGPQVQKTLGIEKERLWKLYSIIGLYQKFAQAT